MADYSIEVSATAERQLKKLSKRDQHRVIKQNANSRSSAREISTA